MCVYVTRGVNTDLALSVFFFPPVERLGHRRRQSVCVGNIPSVYVSGQSRVRGFNGVRCVYMCLLSS